MKQMQMNKLLPINVINAAKLGAAQKVVGLGPQTVAVQLVISSASSPTGTSAQLQASLDNTNFFNVNSAISITANGVLGLADTDAAYAYYRVSYAWTGGSFSVVERWFVYGDTI